MGDWIWLARFSHPFCLSHALSLGGTMGDRYECGSLAVRVQTGECVPWVALFGLDGLQLELP